MKLANRQQQVQLLRVARKLHRVTGITLLAFFLFVSVTGLLLGWKKHSGGHILPESQRGGTTEIQAWLPVATLHQKARQYLRDSVSASLSTEIDRMDIRPDKGMVKILFEGHHHELQLDGATGELLQASYRYSDLFERIHDGSILDTWAGTGNGFFKLLYTTTLALALLLFVVTGFWLWYGPMLLRGQKAAAPARKTRRKRVVR